MNKIKVGDEFWHIPGYIGDHLILIKCKIVEVQDEFEKLYGDDGAVYYWIDEPIGHAVSEDELFIDLEEAVEELKDRLGEEQKEDVNPNATLDEFRNNSSHFISSTHNLDPEQTLNFQQYILWSPPFKTHLKDWFNVNDIIKRKFKNEEKNQG